MLAHVAAPLAVAAVAPEAVNMAEARSFLVTAHSLPKALGGRGAAATGSMNMWLKPLTCALIRQPRSYIDHSNTAAGSRNVWLTRMMGQSPSEP